MTLCKNCGKPIDSNAKICPECGATIEAPVMKQTQQTTKQSEFSEKLTSLNNTTDTTASFDKADIEQNKVMAVLAYFGPLVLVPILAAKDSKFARYHSNQGLILLLTAVAYGIAYTILSAIIFAISWRLGFIITLIGIVGLIFTVLAIIGIINAVNGKAKELPIIGKFKILK